MYLTENDQITYLKMLLGISGSAEDELLGKLLDISNNIALANVFPYSKNFEDLELPMQYNYWVILASKELYLNKDLNTSFQSYSENGISYSLQETQGMLSQSLTSQLIPKASVPK